ncbi:TraB/GumN family protein [Massilia sp. BSC265]|uniref:TraB/GumN family protein n=1 Tax=Massilia sp. BSC265 TaxID=1549812 RepID=UPI0004E8AA17|nr:TraB/GumN family protein [Massilia sp. BSC265]KFI06095.1 hypothetical protein JN27_18515 [Massilia sp. BSC265]
MLQFAILPALCLALCAALYSPRALAQTNDAAVASSVSAPADEPPAAPEQILVVGQKPGPGMWKVSKDDHVLWIFGTYSPLPIKMDWRSHEVEAVIGRSQEYLAPPISKVETSYFQVALALPSLIGINRNPDDATLRDVLPAEVYARWLPLKEKYLPKNKERDRPLFVANELFSAALKQAGLTSSTDVRKQVEKIVEQKKLKVTRTVHELKVDNPRQLIKEFKKSPLDDVACFSNTLKRLETDIDAMRVRANAWAKGDIDAIRKLDFNEQESCSNAIRNSAVLRDHPAFQGAEERHRAMWLANAEAALARNTSTFAVLSMRDLLDPQGLMAALAAKGYTVEQPE